MRTLTLALLGSFVFLGATEVAFATKVSDHVVASHCKGKMQYGGGQAGCTAVEGGVTKDYNCSNGSHGIPKGCTVTVFLTGQPGGKANGLRTDLGGLKANDGSGANKVGLKGTVLTGPLGGSTGPTYPKPPKTPPAGSALSGAGLSKNSGGGAPVLLQKSCLNPKKCH